MENKVEFRASDRFKSELQDAANAAGESMSEYVRQSVRERMRNEGDSE